MRHAARPAAGRRAPPAARNRGQLLSSDRERSLGTMDEQALERARHRIAEARTEGLTGARLDAALERARAEVMRLAKVADDLEASLPKQVSTAVRDGVAREVVPVSRSLAEIRGGLNQALRRLERLEEVHPRGTQRADRRPRDPRRSRLVGLERRGPAPPEARGRDRGRRRAAAIRAGGFGAPRLGRRRGVGQPTAKPSSLSPERGRSHTWSPRRRRSRAAAGPRRAARQAPRRARGGGAAAGSGTARRPRTAPSPRASPTRAP